MATFTYYLGASLHPNEGWRLTSTSAGSAVTNADGWVVGTGATLHSEYQSGTERAASTFTGTAAPDGTLDLTLKDALLIRNSAGVGFLGVFAAGNWTFNFALRPVTVAGTQNGRIRFRLIRSSSLSGAGGVEITSGQQQCSLTGAMSLTTQDYISSLTVSLPEIALINEYLFVQIAWERTAAGGMSTSDVNFRSGSTGPAGSYIITTDFTPSQMVLGASIPFSQFGANTGNLGATGSTHNKLRQDDPTGVYGSGNDIQLSTTVAGQFFKTLIEFDISSIPVGAPVLAVRLLLYYQGGSGATTWTVSLFRCLRNWLESEATWNEYSAGNAWATAGGTGAADRAATASVSLSAPLSPSAVWQTYASAQLTTDVQNIINGTVSNFGWHFDRTDSQSADNHYRTWSGKTGTDGLRPVLEVSYSPTRLFAPSVALGGGGSLQNVTGSTISSTVSVRVPLVAPGPVAVTTPTVASSSVARAATIVPGPVSVTGSTVGSATQVFVPVVSLSGVSGQTVILPFLQNDLIYSDALLNRMVLGRDRLAEIPIRVFGPTVVALAPVIALPQIASTATAFTPTAVPGNVTATLPHIASTAQARVPSVAVGAVAVTTAFVGTTVQVRIPSITVGPVAATTAFIASGLQVRVPSIAVGAISVTTGFVGSTAAVFVPTSTAGPVSVTTPFRASTATLTAPSVATLTLVTTGFVGSTAVLYPLQVAQNVTTAFRASTAVLYLPSSTVGPVAVTTDFIAPTAALYQLIVSTGAIAVITAYLPSGSVARPPSAATGSISVTTPALTNAAQLFPPTTAVGAVTVVTGFCASAATLNPPALGVGATTVTLPGISSTAQVFPPSSAVGPVTITVPLRASTAQTYPPVVVTGAAVVVPGFIASTPVAFAPTAAYAVTAPTVGAASSATSPSVAYAILLPTQTPTSNVFAPALAVGATTVELPVIASTSAIYPLGVAYAVTTPTIANVAEAYGPEVGVEVVIAPIPSTAQLFPPLTGTETYATAAFIASGAVVYAPFDVKALNVLQPAPPERTFVVPFENRVFDVGFVEREFVVPYERRGYDVGFEQRKFIVPFEYRHWEEEYAVPVRHGGKGSRR